MKTEVESLNVVDVICHNNSRSFLIDVYEVIKHAETFYPSFKSWFWDTVVSQLDSRQRSILVEQRGSRIVGVAILKNCESEKKLCNLTVVPEFKGKGIGIKLFERSFTELNSSKPFLTVSEEKYLEFKRLFDHYGFEVTSVADGLYRPGKVEYFLNESVSSLS